MYYNSNVIQPCCWQHGSKVPLLYLQLMLFAVYCNAVELLTQCNKCLCPCRANPTSIGQNSSHNHRWQKGSSKKRRWHSFLSQCRSRLTWNSWYWTLVHRAVALPLSSCKWMLLTTFYYRSKVPKGGWSECQLAGCDHWLFNDLAAH